MNIAFQHPEREQHDQCDMLFDELVYYEMPPSPLSTPPSSPPKSPIDSILDEVLSMHDQFESNPVSPASQYSTDDNFMNISPSHQNYVDYEVYKNQNFGMDSTKNETTQTNFGKQMEYFAHDAPESPNAIKTAQVPFEVQQHNQELLVDEHIDDDVNCSTKLEQQYQPDTVNLICKPNHKDMSTFASRMQDSNHFLQNSETGEIYQVYFVPQDFSPKQEISTGTTIVKENRPSLAPLSPCNSTSTIGSPIPEKQMRKRSQNKMSSKKYREKVKNKEKNLLESVDALHDKKRSIELELAKTKAVNSYLVDQLRAKFGQFL